MVLTNIRDFDTTRIRFYDSMVPQCDRKIRQKLLALLTSCPTTGSNKTSPLSRVRNSLEAVRKFYCPLSYSTIRTFQLVVGRQIEPTTLLRG